MTTATLTTVADLKVGDHLHLSYDEDYADSKDQDVVVVDAPFPSYRPGTWTVDVEDPTDSHLCGPFTIFDAEIAAGLLAVTVKS